MSELLIPILIVMLAFAAVCFLLLVARCWCDGTRAISALFARLRRMNCNQSVKDFVWSDLRAAATKRGGLNCRVRLTK